MLVFRRVGITWFCFKCLDLSELNATWVAKQASYHQQFGKPSGEHCGGWGQRGGWENPWQGVGEKTSENPIGSNCCNLLQFLFQTSNWTPSNLDQNEEKQISVLIFGWIPRKVQIYDRGFVVSDGNKLPDASTTIWNSPGHGSQQKESFWKQRLFGRHKFFFGSHVQTFTLK